MEKFSYWILVLLSLFWYNYKYLDWSCHHFLSWVRSYKNETIYKQNVHDWRIDILTVYNMSSEFRLVAWGSKVWHASNLVQIYFCSSMNLMVFDKPDRYSPTISSSSSSIHIARGWSILSPWGIMYLRNFPFWSNIWILSPRKSENENMTNRISGDWR